MVLLRCLSSWFLISKRNIQVHQKDTLDLSIHSSGLKALNDGGCLRLTQFLSREFKVKSPPPPQPSTCLRECFHWPMGLKRYKNLTGQTKVRHDQCTDSPGTGLTEGTTLLQHPPPPQGLTWRPLSNPWRVGSGTELGNETNQDSKPPMFFLTAGTRNLAIASFLCEYSGPFWGMFSKIRLDIYIYIYI